MVIKRILCLMFVFLWVGWGLPLFANGVQITFQGKVSGQGTDLVKNVEVGLYQGSEIDDDHRLWFEDRSIQFYNDFFSIIIPSDNINNPIDVNDLSTANLHLVLKIGEKKHDFTLTSVPYSGMAHVAEEVLFPKADTLKIGSVFTKRVTMNSDLNVVPANKLFYVNALEQKVGVKKSEFGQEKGLYVGGLVNLSQGSNFYVNGDLIGNTFSWRKKTSDQRGGDQDIYFYDPLNQGYVGIGGMLPPSHLYVRGQVRAKAFTGVELTAIDDWVEMRDDLGVSYNYVDEGYFVGIGTNLVSQTLDVNGGIIIGDSVGTLNGTIRYSTRRGNGLFEVRKNGEWQFLGGVYGAGSKDKIAYFNDNMTLVSDGNVSWKVENQSLSLGQPNPVSAIDIRAIRNDVSFLDFKTKDGGTVLAINSTGNIGIKGPPSSVYELKVHGGVSVYDMFRRGKSLRYAYSTGTYFTSDRDSEDDDFASIFYMYGDVSIGQPDPKNLLEIAAPFKEDDMDVPTKDPAITFQFGSSGLPYTLGVDADGPGLFRVEQSIKLGGEFPLFVALQNRFGIGLEKPDANLHVSGNYGLVISGLINGLEPLEFSGVGSRLFFYAPQAALRLGYLDERSFFNGADWDQNNLGQYSIGMGYNPSVSGNLSSVIGGGNNVVNGAYSTTVGGYGNRVDGYFALGLGYNAYPRRHGSFVWSSSSYLPSQTPIFESKYPNQFIVQAYGGVGFGTNYTAHRGKTSGLSVRGRPVLIDDFDGIDTSFREDVWEMLVRYNYLDEDGYFDRFMSSFSIPTVYNVYPIQVQVSTQNVYNTLVNLYTSPIADQVISTSSLRGVFSTSGGVSFGSRDESGAQAIWEGAVKFHISKQLWSQLLEDGILSSINIVSTDALSAIRYDTPDVNMFVGITDPTGDDLYNSAEYKENGHFFLYTVGGSGTVTQNFIESLTTLLSAAPGLKVIETYFDQHINSVFYSDSAWNSYLDNELHDEVARLVFDALVSAQYIRQDGSFFKFRPLNFVKAGVESSSSDLTSELGFDPEVSTSSVVQTLQDMYRYKIFNSLGTRRQGTSLQGVFVQNPAGVSVGGIDPIRARLVVSGNVAIGIQTPPDPLVPLTLKAQSASSTNYVWAIVGDEGVGTPGMVVSDQGAVGVGSLPAGISTRKLLSVGAGGLFAGDFMLPSGQKISKKPDVYVWSFKQTTPNIYVTINVGIGTRRPNSLLELSTDGDGQVPKIIVDVDGVDHFSFGVSPSYPSKFFLGSGSDFTEGPFVIRSSYGFFGEIFSYVGFGTAFPHEPLEVSGSARFSSFMVATDNIEFDLVVDELKTDSFYLNGKNTESSGLAWIASNNETEEWVYKPLRAQGQEVLIGIGGEPILADNRFVLSPSGDPMVDNLSYVFQVFGVVSPNHVHVRDFLNVREAARMKRIRFKPLENFAYLTVSGNLLNLDIAGVKNPVSEMLTKGIDREGYIGLWVNGTIEFSDSGLYWKGSPFDAGILSWNYSDDHWVWDDQYVSANYVPGTLMLTGNVVLSASGQTISNQVRYSPHDFSFAHTIATSITYDGVYYDDSYSHSVASINLVAETVSDSVKAVDIQINTIPGVSLTGRTQAVGFVSDVSSVQFQTLGTQTRGFAFPALFFGDVGVGHHPSRPSANFYPELNPEDVEAMAVLDVAGGLFADSFIISNRLMTATINVGSGALFVTDEGDVGINTTLPTVKLEVKGDMKASNVIVSDTLRTPDLDVLNGRVKMNTNSTFLGIGMDEPTAFLGNLGLKRVFTDNTSVSAPYSFQVMDVLVTGNFVLDQDLTGLSIAVYSESKNQLGLFNGPGVVAKGIQIDLTLLTPFQEATDPIVLEGLTIAVPSNSYSAIFKNGTDHSIVGIGTETPDVAYALEVLGTLKAKSAPGLDLLGGGDAHHGAVFNHLVVAKAMTVGEKVTVNTRLYVNKIEQESLFNEDQISLSDLEGDVSFIVTGFLKSKMVTVNSSVTAKVVVVVDLYTHDDAIFTGDVVVGSLTSQGALTVEREMDVDSITVNERLDASRLTITGQRPLTVDTVGNVSVGLESPIDVFSVGGFFENSFDVIDNRTWGLLRYQVQANGAAVSGASGVSFIFDDDSVMGIAAVRSSTSSGSDLVFLGKRSQVWVTSSGVGVNASNPSHLLSVVGPSRFQHLAVRDAGRVIMANSLSALTGASIQVPLYVPSTLNVESLLLSYGALDLSNQSAPDLASLGLNNSVYRLNEQLHYRVNLNGMRLLDEDLSATYNFNTAHIPYVSMSSSLQESFSKWQGSDSIFKIGTSPHVSLALHSEIVSEDDVGASFEQEKVVLTFNEPVNTGVEQVFSGVGIHVANAVTLQSDDQVIGLNVDLRDLVLYSRTVIGTDIESVETVTNADRYSALFLGGAVGIISSDNNTIFHPSADVHVVATMNQDVFRAGAFIVNQQGVGIGEESNNGFGITSRGEKTLFYIGSSSEPFVLVEDTLGILAIPDARYALSVGGIMSANKGVFGGLDGSNLQVGQRSFFVPENGAVGFGPESLQASFVHFHGVSVISDSSSDFVQELITTNINLSGGGKDFIDNWTGFSFVVTSNGLTNTLGGRPLGGEVFSFEALGVNVDMTGLEVHSDSRAIGLKIDLTGTSGDLYAAIFRGGGVGIGTFDLETPLQDMLHVKGGTIKAHTISSEVLPDWTLSSATINTLSADLISSSSDWTGLTINVTGTFSYDQFDDRESRETGDETTLVKISMQPTISVTKLNVTQDVKLYGRVAVGTNTDSLGASLNVGGDVSLSEALISDGVNGVYSIIGTDLFVHATTLTVPKGNLVASYNLMTTLFKLSPLSKSDAVFSEDALFSLDQSGDYDDTLVYIDANDVTINLSPIAEGISSGVPYLAFLNQSIIVTTNTSLLSWESGSGSSVSMLSFGDSTTLNSFVVTTDIGVRDVVVGNDNVFNAYSIDVDFDRRVVASSRVFVGIDLVVSGNSLHSEDKVKGFTVDVRNLNIQSSDETSSGVEQVGEKYAAVFDGGDVLFSVTDNSTLLEASANVHLVYYHQSYNSPLNVSSNLIVSRNGFVGIGTSNPDSILKLVSSGEKDLFRIGTISDSYLSITDKVGVGTLSPEAVFHVNGLVGGRALFQVDAGVSTGSVFISGNGSVGLGQNNPTFQLDVLSDNEAPLLLSSLGTTVLFVTNNIGINTQSPSYNLTVSGNVFSGDYFSDIFNTLLRPNWVTSNRGFLVGFSQSGFGRVFSAFSLKKEDLGFKTVLLSSGQSNSVFRFLDSDGSFVDMITLDADNDVGFFTSSPQASFHLKGRENTSILQVGTGTLSINSLGNVGIGVQNASSQLQVAGTVKVNGLKNSSKGTKLTISPTLNIVSTHSEGAVTDMGSFNVNPRVVDPDSVVLAEKVSLTVSDDIINSVTGVQVVVQGDASHEIKDENTTPKGLVYGLKVDVSGVDTKDPSLEQVNVGKTYAALFLDTEDADEVFGIKVKVGIGMAHPKVPLDVVVFDTSANILSSGIIVNFTSGYELTAAGDEDKGSELSIEALTMDSSREFSPIYDNSNYFGQGVETGRFYYFSIPTEAFQVITYHEITAEGVSVPYEVDSVLAHRIMAQLRDEGVINGRNQISPGDDFEVIKNNLGDLTHFAKTYGKYVPVEAVLDVLRQYRNRAIYKFIVKEQGEPADWDRDDDGEIDSGTASATGNWVPLVVVSGTEPIFSKNAFGGHVGINVWTNEASFEPAFLFNDALVVSGNIRLGVLVPTLSSLLTGAGYGPSLLFSGAKSVVSTGKYGKNAENGKGRDNGDTLEIARYQLEVFSASLHVNFSNNPGDSNIPDQEDLFVIGSSTSNGRVDGSEAVGSSAVDDFKASMVVRAYQRGLDSTYAVGIGTKKPVTFLHVKGSRTNDLTPKNDVPESWAEDYLTYFHNLADNPNSLAIMYSAISPEADSNFITFLNISETGLIYRALGAIEGNRGVGVAYASPEADYAEYIPKKNLSEELKPGDIVGVFSGELTKKIAGCDQVMVMSSSPIVVANWPGDDLVNRYGLVAFVGQVPTRVRGVVKKGDLIVASLQGDGVGFALSSNDILPEHSNYIVGQALESSDGSDVTLIKTLVGLPFSVTVKNTQFVELKQRIERLREENKRQKARFERILEERQKKITFLKDKVSVLVQ